MPKRDDACLDSDDYDCRHTADVAIIIVERPDGSFDWYPGGARDSNALPSGSSPVEITYLHRGRAHLLVMHRYDDTTTERIVAVRNAAIEELAALGQW